MAAQYESAYKILSRVMLKGEYLGVALKNLPEPKAFNTRLIYGVLERDVTLEYFVSKLCARRPKPAITLLLKMGLYMLKYMDEPPHAVVNGIVETARYLGKQGAGGFLNAVLRRHAELALPQGEDAESLSVIYSIPIEFVNRIVGDYGIDTAKVIMQGKERATHIRHNGLKTTRNEFENLLQSIENKPPETTIYGYYVRHTTLDVLFRQYADMFTPQGLGSMLVCRAFELKRDMRVLDICAAPGGKSVYLAELLAEAGGGSVVARDIHSHRVELIRAYASRMSADVQAEIGDGTVFEPKYEGAFDAVLCDAPCSGLGVIKSKPDILRNRAEKDIKPLCELQLKLLNNSARYVASGGQLVYSTCTVLREENEGVVKSFLKSNPDFSLCMPRLGIEPQYKIDIDAVQFLQGIDEVEGFFIAKLVKGGDRRSV